MKTIYYRLKRIEADTEAMEPGEEVDALWNEVHEQNAREMREHAEEAKGLFIKAGQVMSAMVGTLPDPYTREFLSLTEHLPVSTIDEVFRTIRKDLKRPPRDLFSSFDPEPIASASIAQVHKARLRSTGEVVAVKVQHDGVDRVFLEDVSTLSVVAGQVAFWQPDLDFRKFAEEWSESLPHELDFHQERRALERAGSVLRKAGNKVIVPRVHKRLYGQHVFVMEFIEAEPIMRLQEKKFCEQNNVDKHAVLRTLLDAFGIMAFKDGMFHADPHAGNVRILLDKNAPGGAAPVLFDWGLFREISDEERMGLAKAFHCLGNFDIAGLFDVLQALGFQVRPEFMTDDFRRELLEKARGVMKDTVNRETTRANMRKELNEYKERLKRAEAHGDGMEGSVSPIYFLEDWPRCIIFFMRMLQILRGMCVAVDAEGMPILQIFAKHAREALKEGSQRQSLVSRVRMFSGREARNKKQTSSEDLQQERTEARAAADATLEARIAAKLKALVDSQRAVGAQVAVVQGGRLLCNVAGGTLSTIDSRPVQTSTRFPLMGATPGIASLAALRLLARMAAEGEGSTAASLESALRTPVTQLWPQFSGGCSEVTLADLLSHRAGVQDAFPTSFTPQLLDDVQTMVQHFEQVSLPSAKDARYSYYLQAFIMTKLGDCMAGKDSLLHWLGDELGPLGLDIAAPAGRGGEAAICRDLPELARVSMSEVNTGRERRMEKANSPKDAGSSGKEAAAVGTVSTHTLLQAIARYPLVFDPLQANSKAAAPRPLPHTLASQRRAMRSALCLPCLLLSASALRLLTTPPAEYPWAGKNGGKLRTGASAFVAPRALEKGPAWSFHEADEMVDYHRISPLSQVNYPQFWGLIRATPLIDDKLNIYVSTVSEGRLYKFDPDGRQLWLYKDAPFVALPGISALLEGRLFAANTAGEAFALDMETGETLWKTKIAGAIAGDTWSMAAAEGVVIAPTIVNGTGGNNKRLVALNASDGSVMWNFDAAEDIYNILVSIKNGSCVFSTALGRVYRLDLQTGERLWEVPPPEHPGFTTGGSVLGPDGETVYTTWNEAYTKGNQTGMVGAFNFSDGRKLWATEVSYEANNGAAVGLVGSGSSARLAVVVGVGTNPFPPALQFGIRSGAGGPDHPARILALDAATGQPLWKHELPPWHGAAMGDDKRPDICLPDAFSNPAIGGDGTVYVGFQSGLIYSVRDEDGNGAISEEEVSSFQTGAAFQGSPGIAPGMLVATSCDGVHVFKLNGTEAGQ